MRRGTPRTEPRQARPPRTVGTRTPRPPRTWASSRASPAQRRRTRWTWPTAHKPFPAQLPRVQAGPVATYDLVLKDVTVQIAPGVKYSAWAWAGGAPGPVIHVRQGQTVDITLTNQGAIPHSIDFHAARVAPNVYFKDVIRASRSTSASRRTTPASTCTTAARSRCSCTSQTGCTERSWSSPRPECCRRWTGTTSSSPASGTSTPTG